MSRFMNETPIEHRSHHGTLFKAKRGDLVGGVTVLKYADISEAQFCADVAEFAAWHRNAIWENLNGFSGYDATQYEINIRK